MLIVELVVKVGHVVGVFFSIFFVRSVEGEPFSEFEHGSEEVHVLGEGKDEVFGANGSSFLEWFVASDFSQQTQHNMS